MDSLYNNSSVNGELWMGNAQHNPKMDADTVHIWLLL